MLLHSLFFLWMVLVSAPPLPGPDRRPPPRIAVSVEPRVPPGSRTELPPEPAPPVPERQIVAPPEAGREVAPENTRLLSDVDRSTEVEQIARGESGESSAGRRLEVPEDRPETQESARSETGDTDASPGEPPPRVALADLLPDTRELLGSGWAEAPAPKREPPQEAFAERAARTNLFLSPGSRDYLPGLREGDITLLNTKAYRFAPFVRRVAGRVFDHLVIALRRTIHDPGVHPGREIARVEAVMDGAGNFLYARVLERVGSNGLRLDQQLLRAATPRTFFDANPPPGVAAEDGNIHFLLFLDLSVFPALNPVSGLTVLGYRGVAGVGLR
ncbi:MAG: hypothetical protein KatS3mg076_0517 [Candidatus Binatia bacterium]|nr:MAG: hypothetical protein KatS3mg076_0517 [Candidatus Binatia bacterium]